jgi:hypothetical protein
MMEKINNWFLNMIDELDQEETKMTVKDSKVPEGFN